MHSVRLVDMGPTHYNEIANDGQTVYMTTRSTGQIEEGPVGFSITNLDNDVVSWRFKPLGEWPFVMITSPVDERLLTNQEAATGGEVKKMTVRVKAWATESCCEVMLKLVTRELILNRSKNPPFGRRPYKPTDFSTGSVN
jgi:Icc protein